MNDPQFPHSFGMDPSAPSLPDNPNWMEELKFTLFEGQHFSSYQPPVPPTAFQQYKAQLLLALFSHLPFEVLGDDVPYRNFLWDCDIISRGHALNPIAQTKLHTFLDQLHLLLNWHKISQATSDSLDEIDAIRIHSQYEAENLLEEYDAFKNKDSVYWIM